MIVLDIETSGVDFLKCGIWQIGAVDFENPENQFLDECRIDDEDIIEGGTLKVTGKTEAEMRNSEKQSQKELLERLFEWSNKIRIKNFICQNPQFDTTFLKIKALKYGLEYPFHYRAFDLHSVAQTKYYEINRKFVMDDNKSGMNLTNVLNFCGLKDERKYHNALEDAKLTAECFSRIINGKNLLEEFKKFKIPKYLE